MIWPDGIIRAVKRAQLEMFFLKQEILQGCEMQCKKEQNSGLWAGSSLKIEMHFKYYKMPAQVIWNAIAYFTKCHLKLRWHFIKIWNAFQNFRAAIS